MSSTGGPSDISAPRGLEPREFAPEFKEVKDILQDYIATKTTVSYVKAEDFKAMGWAGADKKPILEKPVLNIEDMTRALMEIQTKLQDEQIKFSKEDIKNIMQKNKEEHQKRLKKIQEHYDKMKKAKKGGVFGKVFGWIATAVLAIAAVAMIATGVGVGAGIAMLAAATIMLMSQISAETGNWMAEGLADMFEAFGMDREDAMLAGQIFVAVVVTALTIGAGVGASTPAWTSTAANIAAKIAQAAQIVGGAAMVGQGAAAITTSVYTKQAEDARADSKDMLAFMKKLQMMLEDEMERVKEILRKMEEGVDVVMSILSGQQDTKSFLIQQQGV